MKYSEKSDRAAARTHLAEARNRHLIAEAGEAYAGWLGLDRGFTRIDVPAPSLLAVGVARVFLARAQERLREFFKIHRDSVYEPRVLPGWRASYCMPRDFGPRVRLHLLPLPLVQACCPVVAQGFPELLSTRSLRALRPDWDWRAAQLRAAIDIEHDLWTRCAGMDRIPYPFAFRALQDIYRPDLSGHVACLCLRCGVPLDSKQRRKVLALHCACCIKDGRLNSPWPIHAVMPHTRGAWWLECQVEDCYELFVGRKQRLRCDDHRLERVSPRRRVPVSARSIVSRGPEAVN